MNYRIYSWRQRRIFVMFCSIALGIFRLKTAEFLVDARVNSVIASSPSFDLFPSESCRYRQCPSFYNSQKVVVIVQLCRGGATSSKPSSSNTKQKKSKKKKKKGQTRTPKETQEVVNQKLKEKDAAQALGDAIRDRASVLRFGSNIDAGSSATRTMESVGYALGASDYMMAASNANGNVDDSDTSIAEELTAPAAVIVQYFLKSHGGAHALQCICSLFATIAGIVGCLIRGNKTASGSLLQLTFIKRCMMFAICKHASGLLAAAYAAATTIPTTGFQQAVAWMQTMSKDPVSQYVFYAAAVLFWLPSTSPVRFKAKSAAEIPINQPAWWQALDIVPFLLVGPVVIRECISVALVVADVLVLIIAATSTSSVDDIIYKNHTLKRILMFSQAIVDSIMSIVVTPQIWRSSTALQRQAILAKLTTKISLALELAVGILMTSDSMMKAVSLLFLNTGNVSFPQLIKTCIVTQLYLQFLWTRRKKIVKLAASVRGGALGAPSYFLDVLLHPAVSMGLPKTSCDSLMAELVRANETDDEDASSQKRGLTILDYVRIALDMDD